MNRGFEGKVCVLTGGANGIGRCILQSFAERGAKVAFIDVDEAAGRELEGKYGGCFFFAGDISCKEILREFAGAVVQKYGRVDFLINNACYSNKGILSGCSYEDFSQILSVGVAAPYYLALLFRDVFAQGACIVNIASTRGYMSQPDTESYTAAKGGILALTHGLAASLMGRVRVNAVSPGWIDTREYQSTKKDFTPLTKEDSLQHPAGRVGEPGDIANMVLFLCSPQAGFITGQDFTVDGGMTRQMIYNGDFGWTYSGPEQTG